LGREKAHNLVVGGIATLGQLRRAVDHRPGVGQTDEHLVAQVRAGDDAAFEEIYDRYARRMLAFCVQMLGSREAAEDALQLTFVSAYRALRGGESDISLQPWLYTIARNRCLTELRARPDTVDLAGATLDRPSFEGLADQVQRRDELREMVADIQRLPDDQRAALVLFELGDHSHHEIAAVLDVRREKVKALIFQAREALVRGRQARGHSCVEIRERLTTLSGSVLSRGVTRAHIDRCPSCAAFEVEVRRQRAALALILPVTLTGELKALVLGSALGGGGAAAAGAGVCGSGAAVSGGATAGGGACGAGALSAGAAGSLTAAGTGTGAAGSLAAAGAAGGLAATGAGTGAIGSLAVAGAGAAGTAVVTGAPVAAVATGLTVIGADSAAGAGGLGATGVVAKILAVAALATGAVGASHVTSQPPPAVPGPASSWQIPRRSAISARTLSAANSGPSTPTAATTPAATPSSSSSGSPPAATPSSSGSSSPSAGTPSSNNPATPPAAAPSSATSTGPPPAAPSSVNPTSSPPATPSPSGPTTPATPSPSGSGAATPSPSGSGAATPASSGSGATTPVPSGPGTTAAPSDPGAASPAPSDPGTATPVSSASGTATADTASAAPSVPGAATPATSDPAAAPPAPSNLGTASPATGTIIAAAGVPGSVQTGASSLVAVASTTATSV
jgi:RNA polymerase sigma factor (sigma-70 family)